MGELWFKSDKALRAALEPPDWAEAVKDAERYLDTEWSRKIIV